MNLKIPTLLALTFLLCSCATLLNKPEQKIYLFKETDSLKVCVNGDTIPENQQQIKIKRDKAPAQIIVSLDEKNDTAYLYSKLDPVFVLGNSPITYAFPFGYVVDAFTRKIYMYPTYNKLLFNNGTLLIDQPKLPVNFILGIKTPSLISLTKMGLNLSTVSAFGIDMGAEAYFKVNRYISGSLNFNIPATVNSSWGQISLSSFNANMLYNVEFEKIHIGAGINVSVFNVPQFEIYSDFIRTTSLGPSIEVQLKLYPDLYLISVYNGSVLDLHNNKLINGKTLSLGIKYKFEMMNFENKLFRSYIE